MNKKEARQLEEGDTIYRVSLNTETQKYELFEFFVEEITITENPGPCGATKTFFLMGDNGGDRVVECGCSNLCKYALNPRAAWNARLAKLSALDREHRNAIEQLARHASHVLTERNKCNGS